jgi:hypothetical protein
MVSLREILLAFLVPALLCVLLGAQAARLEQGFRRRLVQALALALPCLLGFYAVSHYVPYAGPLSSATEIVPFLALPLAAASALRVPGLPLFAALGLGAALFSRLASPPGWPERCAAVLVLALAWSASRSATRSDASWRPPLVLATFAGAVACACLCGRVASLALIAAGLGASAGACFLASLRRPAWAFGLHGHDVGVFALGGILACAVYLGELRPFAALLLLGSLAAARIPRFASAFGVQLGLTALGLWFAWPADGRAP